MAHPLHAALVSCDPFVDFASNDASSSNDGRGRRLKDERMEANRNDPVLGTAPAVVLNGHGDQSSRTDAGRASCSRPGSDSSRRSVDPGGGLLREL